MPKPVYKITITVTDEGTLDVEGNVDDQAVVAAMLEGAKDAVRIHNLRRDRAEKLVVPASYTDFPTN